jgi:hypothetical protein
VNLWKRSCFWWESADFRGKRFRSALLIAVQFRCSNAYDLPRFSRSPAAPVRN